MSPQSKSWRTGGALGPTPLLLHVPQAQDAVEFITIVGNDAREPGARTVQGLDRNAIG